MEDDYASDERFRGHASKVIPSMALRTLAADWSSSRSTITHEWCPGGYRRTSPIPLSGVIRRRFAAEAATTTSLTGRANHALALDRVDVVAEGEQHIASRRRRILIERDSHSRGAAGRSRRGRAAHRRPPPLESHPFVTVGYSAKISSTLMLSRAVERPHTRTPGRAPLPSITGQHP